MNKFAKFQKIIQSTFFNKKKGAFLYQTKVAALEKNSINKG